MQRLNQLSENIVIVCLEIFEATELHKMFSGRQPRQIVKIPRRFRD